jgi:SnoaL-like protein
MNTSFRNLIIKVFSIGLIIFIIGCQSDHNKNSVSMQDINTKEQNWDQDQMDVKTAVEKILIAGGNRNFEELDKLTSDNAIIGYSYLKDGVWSNNELTIKEYIENNAAKTDLKPFVELPTNYEIIVTEGRIALVKADAVLSRFGVPLNREVNHFTFIKEGGDWQLLSIAWTVERLPEEKRKIDIDLFAHSYAQAWSGIRPEFVALYFAENRSLQVNDGKPAVGRAEITKVAKGFMTDLPDMIVSFDSLVNKSDGVDFHWTLTATNSGPGGTGNKIKVSGYEYWQMSEDGLIAKSQGHFSSEEYNRQIQFGTDK